MSIAKNARASEVMQKHQNGSYVKQGKFANFGSVPEDSIYYSTMLAQKADQERRERIAQSKIRLRQRGLA
jgi:hypothetical protein